MIRNNLYKTLRINTPPGFRTVRFIAWLKVYTAYLFMIIEDLFQFYTAKDKEAKMTPQIAYLEHILNERYGTGTEIFISDGYLIGPWIWLDGDTPDPEFYMDLANSFVYTESDSITIDFVVNIPESIKAEVQNIAAIVQKYKLAGKSFIIQIY